MVHELKTDSKYFIRLFNGEKTFELRKNDQDFRSGDVLILRETHAETLEYTGRKLYFVVSYTLVDYPGLKPGFIVLALKPSMK